MDWVLQGTGNVVRKLADHADIVDPRDLRTSVFGFRHNNNSKALQKKLTQADEI